MPYAESQNTDQHHPRGFAFEHQSVRAYVQPVQCRWGVRETIKRAEADTNGIISPFQEQRVPYQVIELNLAHQLNEATQSALYFIYFLSSILFIFKPPRLFD